MARGIDFRQKEVINIRDGKVLGFVIDVDAELTNGSIKSIVVAGAGKLIKSIGGNVPMDTRGVHLVIAEVVEIIAHIVAIKKSLSDITT